MNKKFEKPYAYDKIKELYGKNLADKLSKDPVHKWRMETGLELIHKEPTLDEQERIWKNWQLMSDEEKEISDKKCLEISGMTNEELNDWIMKNHWNKLNKFDLTYKNIIKNMENK